MAVPRFETARTAGAIMDFIPALPRDARLETIADVFLDDPEHDFIVMLDEHEHPTVLTARAGVLRGEPYEHDVTTVTGGASLRTVAECALARPLYERFDPLVCVDAEGRYVGAIRMDGLLAALAGVTVPQS